MCSDRTVPFSVGSDGLLLHVRLTPKGGRDAIDGVENLANGQSVLKIRVRAVPEDGKANKALMKLLAESLGIPPSQIALQSGQTARIKVLKISGNPQMLADLFAAKGRNW